MEKSLNKKKVKTKGEPIRKKTKEVKHFKVGINVVYWDSDEGGYLTRNSKQTDAKFAEKYNKLVDQHKGYVLIDEEGRAHHPSQPARVHKTSGREEWYWHGYLHRLDGPAYINPDANTKDYKEKFCINEKVSKNPRLCKSIIKHNIPTEKLLQFSENQDVVVANIAAYKLLRHTKVTPPMVYQVITNSRICPQVIQLALNHPLSNPAWEIVH